MNREQEEVRRGSNAEEEKMVTCPKCKRSQPESLGACDFCEEMRQDAQEAKLAHTCYDCGETFENCICSEKEEEEF